jgi:hypothetical protein
MCLHLALFGNSHGMSPHLWNAFFDIQADPSKKTKDTSKKSKAQKMSLSDPSEKSDHDQKKSDREWKDPKHALKKSDRAWKDPKRDPKKSTREWKDRKRDPKKSDRDPKKSKGHILAPSTAASYHARPLKQYH